MPLAAAGAVVVAGHSGHRWGIDALLSTRPAAFVGDISYALYLVHWPILVLWLHHSGQARAGAARTASWCSPGRCCWPGW